MKKVVSEDAVRRALKAMDEGAGIAWLDGQLRACTDAALSMGQWILDTDTTVKCLYGKQEGDHQPPTTPARRGPSDKTRRKDDFDHLKPPR